MHQNMSGRARYMTDRARDHAKTSGNASILDGQHRKHAVGIGHCEQTDADPLQE